MKTIVRFDKTGEIDAFKALAEELNADEKVKGLLVFACDANGWTPDSINPFLIELDKPVFGGIFPQVIFDKKNYQKGTLVVGLPVYPHIATVTGLSDSTMNYDSQILPVIEEWDRMEQGAVTYMVLVDGLSKCIAALVQSLFFCFGLEYNFIGGGAGSLSFQQKPCLITPTGLLADAAIIVRMPVRSGIGVSHGWQPISSKMKVTDSEKNEVNTLDNKPAFEVYKKLVEDHSSLKLGKDNFFELAKCYPLGITKLGTDIVVRDPLMVSEKNGLICVGEVPKGCFVKLLSGTPELLIKAAEHSKNLAEQSAPIENSGEQTAIFFDCISRVLYLEDAIVKELEAAGGERPLLGALTLGEIANSGKEYLEFYNKTAVLGIFYS